MFVLFLAWVSVRVASAGPQPQGPADALPAFQPSNAEIYDVEVEMMAELLRRYSDKAHQVFVGKVLNTHHPYDDPYQGTHVTFAVNEQWRGRPTPILDVFVPPEGDYMEGDPAPAPLSIVPGYTMLVFLDRDGTAIASNALFLVAGGFAWRNKNEDVFLAPARDREWVEAIDPSADYVVYPLALIRESVQGGGGSGIGSTTSDRRRRGSPPRH